PQPTYTPESSSTRTKALTTGISNFSVVYNCGRQTFLPNSAGSGINYYFVHRGFHLFRRTFYSRTYFGVWAFYTSRWRNSRVCKN
ncbi:hypothetical protein M5D96_010802, partial [Drosophila gunungcola]